MLMTSFKVFLIFTLIFLLIINFSGNALAEETTDPEIEITVDSWGNVVVRSRYRETSTVFQFGAYNFSLQLGDKSLYNINAVLQTGEMNFSAITQEGEDNRAEITQSGDDNTAVIKQSSGDDDQENKEED